MTPLVYANEAVFCFTLITYLLVAFVGVVCFAMSVSYKLRLYYVLPEVVISAVSVALFCGFADGVRIRYGGVSPDEVVGSLCFTPTWMVVLIALTLVALVAVWVVLVVKKRLSALTAMSVKEAIAALSSGLCFYDETGRVLLLNEQMDNECKQITGAPLYDGKAFWQDICSGNVVDGITVTQSEGSVIAECSDGRALCYKRITHDFDGKTVYELCGADISAELALKKEIEQKNEYLRKMNLRLRKYGEIVTEVTREREILAARVKVHGNLGSLILRTKKSLMQGEYDRDALVSDWNDVMALIFASDEDEDKFADADKTASGVGVRIFYDGKRPPAGTAAEKIFAAAVFECVVNTARHADGTELYVKLTEDETNRRITVTNNGNVPTEEIREGGGLSSLRTMTENVGGQMTVRSLPSFALELTVPKENNTNDR